MSVYSMQLKFINEVKTRKTRWTKFSGKYCTWNNGNVVIGKKINLKWFQFQ